MGHTPVPGYREVSEEDLNKVTTNKETEERILRMLDELEAAMVEQSLSGHEGGPVESYFVHRYDQRWLKAARGNIEIGFMLMNRAIMQPNRISVPEDFE